MRTAEARPRRRIAGADISRANATPKSDIEIRIPTENIATSISNERATRPRPAAKWREQRQRAQAADRERGADNRRDVRVGGRDRMGGALTEVQMPVCGRFAGVDVRVAIQSSAERSPETEPTEHDQERAAEHLAPLLHGKRQRPAEQDQRRGPGTEQQRVPDRKPERNTKRPRTLNRRPTRHRCDRQRRDAHQVIGPETVQESERQGRKRSTASWYSETTIGAPPRQERPV